MQHEEEDAIIADTDESDGQEDEITAILSQADDSDDEEEEPDEDDSDDEDDEEPEPYEPKPKEEERMPIDNDLIFSAIDYGSDMVTNLCISISDDRDGKKYLKTDKQKAEFSNKVSKYLNQQGYTMSPAMGIIIATFLFFGVPLGIAFVRRGTNKKAKIAAAAQAAAIAAANEKQQQQQPAFTANISPAAPEQCKEAREKRRSFDIYSGTGCYKLPPDTGDAKNALGAANATEKPSAIVAELIAKGMSNATIREYLGYE
jgi:hypothetical protein